MVIKINGKDVPKLPMEFTVDIIDLDDNNTTSRTADGTLHRDRVAVKRKLNIKWGLLRWDDLSEILKLVSAVFFEVYYPDSMTGDYETKTFYVGDRSAPVAISRNGEILWEGLSMNFTEK